MARTEEGGLVPAQKGLDGAFHVDGDSVLVPKELQYNTFQLILPILEAVGDRKLIIVTPIPRYLLQRCCSDPEHVPNLASEDYPGRCWKTQCLTAGKTSRILPFAKVCGM